MAASYPGTIKTFSTKASGQAIASSHINDLQNEVVAIETQLGTNAGAWQSYTPTWTATTTNPTLGNATLTGRYVQIGKVVTININLTFGTTTALGTGNHYFSIPVTAATGAWEGTARFRNAGSANYFRISSINSALSTDNITYFSSVSGNDSMWTETSPFVMGNGDSLIIQMVYGAA